MSKTLTPQLTDRIRHLLNEEGKRLADRDIALLTGASPADVAKIKKELKSKKGNKYATT